MQPNKTKAPTVKLMATTRSAGLNNSWRLLSSAIAVTTMMLLLAEAVPATADSPLLSARSRKYRMQALSLQSRLQTANRNSRPTPPPSSHHSTPPSSNDDDDDDVTTRYSSTSPQRDQIRCTSAPCGHLKGTEEVESRKDFIFGFGTHDERPILLTLFRHS